jgi:hypothetical protein
LEGRTVKGTTKRSFRNKKGVAPVIATVIITGTIIALVTVAMIFANNLLTATMAQSDFNSAKQFMQTIALQIDDTAWRIGQRDTVYYSSRYGTIGSPNTTVLTYKINVTDTVSGVALATYSENTTIAYFYMRVSYYSISNNYFSQIWPSQSPSLAYVGPSAPVARLFAVEKMPMSDGSYIRVVAAPVIRLINSTINTASNSTFYFKLYLPLLSLKSSRALSQSVTLTGDSISILTKSSTKSIRIGISVSFPKSLIGFDYKFFGFSTASPSMVVVAPSGYNSWVAEVYAGAVAMSIG